MSWKFLLPMDELWEGEKRGMRVGNRKILLIRLEGKVHAYEDRCLHLGVPLSEGTLNGCVLQCRAHHWEYDMRTGAGVNPDHVSLKRFTTKVSEGKIFVDLEGVP